MSLPIDLPSRRKDKDIARDKNIPDHLFKTLSAFEHLWQNSYFSLPNKLAGV